MMTGDVTRAGVTAPASAGRPPRAADRGRRRRRAAGRGMPAGRRPRAGHRAAGPVAGRGHAAAAERQLRAAGPGPARLPRSCRACAGCTSSCPRVAVVVLTGMSDEHLGAEAVRAGAQDYLVKGQVDGLAAAPGDPLRHRAAAVWRRSSASCTRRGSWPGRTPGWSAACCPRRCSPTPRLTVATRYRPGGGQSLLGGDFYDVVETADGWVHALIGDVCGRGPDEAALGVCLRVAWRTMVLAGRPMDETLSAVERVLEHERQQDRMFTTAVRAVGRPGPRPRAAAPGRAPAATAAGLSDGGVRELTAPACLPVGIGADRGSWRQQRGRRSAGVVGADVSPTG